MVEDGGGVRGKGQEAGDASVWALSSLPARGTLDRHTCPPLGLKPPAQKSYLISAHGLEGVPCRCQTGQGGSSVFK